MCGVALLGAAICLAVRSLRPDLAKPITVAVLTVMFFLLMETVLPILDQGKTILTNNMVPVQYLETVMKAVGISYLTAFGADACRDLEQSSLAGTVEWIGNVFILSLAVPYLMDFAEQLTEILS